MLQYLIDETTESLYFIESIILADEMPQDDTTMYEIDLIPMELESGGGATQLLLHVPMTYTKSTNTYAIPKNLSDVIFKSEDCGIEYDYHNNISHCIELHDCVVDGDTLMNEPLETKCKNCIYRSK